MAQQLCQANVDCSIVMLILPFLAPPHASITFMLPCRFPTLDVLKVRAMELSKETYEFYGDLNRLAQTVSLERHFVGRFGLRLITFASSNTSTWFTLLA